MKNHLTAVCFFDLTPLAVALLSGLGIGAMAMPLMAADTFTGLGLLSSQPGEDYTNANGISYDGSVVVGQAGSQPFRWANGTMTGFGKGGSLFRTAKGVSGDGNVVVGYGYSGNGGTQAFRWTQSDGMVNIGSAGSMAEAASFDGSVVVGSFGGANSKAFRWTQADGMVDLGKLSGDLYSTAKAVSADGNTVVGQSLANFVQGQAYRWTQAGGMVGLGQLGGSTSSEATGVSADGNVVVGNASSNAGNRVFRWTQAGSMVDLGVLGNARGSSNPAVSADGNVVVGASLGAFRWTEASGMISVTSWLAGAGVSIPSGWTLNSATGVNANGSIIVGNGQDPNGKQQAWLARVGTSPSGSGENGGSGSGVGNGFLPSIATFNSTIAESASLAAQAGAGAPSLTLFGAHHRSILDSGLASTTDGVCAWTTGDAARNNDSDTRMGIVEVGACKDIGSSRIGVGIGQAWAQQDWSLGGGAKYDGQYLIAEAANAFSNGLQPSLTAFYGWFDTTMNRHYQNGASIDSSRGTPDASSKAIRLRLDWKNAVQLRSVSISPYAAYAWMRTSLDGYTEKSGGFAARFDNSRWDTNDVRVGVAGALPLTPATDLRLGAEVVHRFEGNTAGSSGQVLGLWSFKTQGASIKQTWARVTTDVDYRINNHTLITVGANAGTDGGDPNWGLTAGLKASF